MFLCGSDLHILKGDIPETTPGTVLGHEAVGTVQEIGSSVSTLAVGDRVLMSCISSCGRCRYCKEARSVRTATHCFSEDSQWITTDHLSCMGSTGAHGCTLRSMKRAAVLVIFVVLVLLPACGNASASPHGARIDGSIRLCGGPAPGRCFSQEGTVALYDAQHHLLSTQHTRHGGRFSFAVSPGTYTLQAGIAGAARVGKQTVVARAHKTTKMNVVIPIP